LIAEEMSSFFDALNSLKATLPLEIAELCDSLAVEINGEAMKTNRESALLLIQKFWALSCKDCFRVEICLRKAPETVQVTIYKDCTCKRPTLIFGQRWDKCNRCWDYLARFKEIEGSKEIASGPELLYDFVLHLMVCEHRKAELAVSLVCDKTKINEAVYSEVKALPNQRISTWYSSNHFQSFVRSLTIHEFQRIYVSGVSQHIFVVHDFSRSHFSNGFIITNFSSVPSIAQQGDLTVRALSIVNYDRKGLGREVAFENAPSIPLSFFFVKGSSDFTNLKPFSKFIAYSALSVLSDRVIGSSQEIRFIKHMPVGDSSVMMRFETSGAFIVLDERSSMRYDDSFDWLKAAFTLQESFCDSLGSLAYATLRKTVVRDVLTYTQRNLVEILREVHELSEHYGKLKDNLVTSRIEELGKIVQILGCVC
jgi:hypothetical protein